MATDIKIEENTTIELSKESDKELSNGKGDEE